MESRMHWKVHVRFGKGFLNKHIFIHINIWRFNLLFHTVVKVISCYKILFDAGKSWNLILLLIIISPCPHVVRGSWILVINYSLVLSYIYDYGINISLNNILNTIIWKNKIQIVKIFIMIGQSASIYHNILQRLKIIKPVIYKNIINSSISILNKNKYIKPSDTPYNFNEWLVGITDGDGCFNVFINSTKISFKFKISQSINNVKLVHYIKKELGVGHINMSGGMISYELTNIKHIKEILFPIFDNWKLLSSKRFNYLKFKECMYIWEDENLSKDLKLDLIKFIKGINIPKSYQSDGFLNLKIKDIKSDNDINKLISKSWLSGYIEAKGSFYLVIKDRKMKRIVHGFEVSQKLDPILLYSIKYILHIKSNIRYKEKYNYYLIETINSKDIEYIINYFITNDFSTYLKGIKSFEFSLWRRSYFKYKGNNLKLLKIRDFIIKKKENK